MFCQSLRGAGLTMAPVTSWVRHKDTSIKDKHSFQTSEVDYWLEMPGNLNMINVHNYTLHICRFERTVFVHHLEILWKYSLKTP